MRILLLAAAVALSGCVLGDGPRQPNDYMRMYAWREGTLSDHEKEKYLSTCWLALEPGKIRVYARDGERRYEVTAEGPCDAPSYEALSGREFDVIAQVEFKGDRWMKHIGCKLRILRVDQLVWGTLEGARESRELRAEFMASRGR